jgi:hypothetical protein
VRKERSFLAMTCEERALLGGAEDTDRPVEGFSRLTRINDPSSRLG